MFLFYACNKVRFSRVEACILFYQSNNMHSSGSTMFAYALGVMFPIQMEQSAGIVANANF